MRYQEWVAKESIKKDSTLVGFWPLLFNFQDYSGNNNHVPVIASGLKSRGHLGANPNTLKRATTLSRYNTPLWISRTWTGWFRTSDVDAVLVDSTSSGIGWKIEFVGNYCQYYSNQGSGQNLISSFLGKFNKNSWTHFAVINPSTNPIISTDLSRFSMYINGISLRFDSATSSILGTPSNSDVFGANIQFGTYDGNAALYRQYLRALSANEISNLYQRENKEIINRIYKKSVSISFAPALISYNGNIPLYTSGIDTFNNNIPLFTSGLDSINSNAPLFTFSGNPTFTNNVDLFVSGLDIINGNIPLFMMGQDSYNGNIPLFIEGGNPSINNNAPLYIYGQDSFNGNIPLYLENPIPTQAGNIPLYIYGQDSNNNNIPLYTVGVGSSNNNAPLFINGVLTKNAPMNLFTRGATLGGGYSLLDLTLTGSSGNGQYSSTDLYIYSGPDGNKLTAPLNLVLAGPSQSDNTATMPLVVTGVMPSIAGMVPLSINANQKVVGAIASMFVEGTGGTQGALPYNSYMNLFLQRNPAEMIPLFIKGAEDPTKATLPLYLEGANLTSKSVNLSIPATIDTKLGTLKLFTHGF